MSQEEYDLLYMEMHMVYCFEVLNLRFFAFRMLLFAFKIDLYKESSFLTFYRKNFLYFGYFNKRWDCWTE